MALNAKLRPKTTEKASQTKILNRGKRDECDGHSPMCSTSKRYQFVHVPPSTTIDERQIKIIQNTKQTSTATTATLSALLLLPDFLIRVCCNTALGPSISTTTKNEEMNTIILFVRSSLMSEWASFFVLLVRFYLVVDRGSWFVIHHGCTHLPPPRLGVFQWHG